MQGCVEPRSTKVAARTAKTLKFSRCFFHGSIYCSIIFQITMFFPTVSFSFHVFNAQCIVCSGMFIYQFCWCLILTHAHAASSGSRRVDDRRVGQWGSGKRGKQLCGMNLKNHQGPSTPPIIGLVGRNSWMQCKAGSGLA